MSSYESQRSSSGARTLIAGGAVLALVGAAWLILRTSEPAALPQPSIEMFRSELASIGVPAGTTMAGPAEESVKIGSLLLTGRYVLQQTDVDARAPLRAELQAHGWQYQSGSDGPAWIDNYCKAPFAAKVQPAAESSSPPTVELSLSWNETTLLKCGDAPSK